MVADVAELIDQKTRSRELPEATALASRWTADEPENAKAWSKLAYVQELNRDFPQATKAMERALTITKDHPPYLFKLGVLAFRSAALNEAAQAFARCVRASISSGDDYYLDAARVAQARCLLLAGDAEESAAVLADVTDDAATWLDGRWTAADVSRAISELREASRHRFRPKPGG